jgi:hypothetical protein
LVPPPISTHSKLSGHASKAPQGWMQTLTPSRVAQVPPKQLESVAHAWQPISGGNSHWKSLIFT